MSLGWLVTPNAVPIYDGVGAPDEPYRYVAAPATAKQTAGPTSGAASSPVHQGRNTNGMSVQTAEQGPQASLFMPPAGLAAPGAAIEVKVVPQAPTGNPPGGTIDGNVYLFTITDKAGPVTLTDQAALATLYLRATTAKQPGPVMEYRSDASKPWQALKTSRGGQDVYVSTFPGAGQFALAFVPVKGAAQGTSILPMVLLGGLVLLVVVVVVIRLQATSE
ncbi:MAG: hypothetical protein JWM02_758 [Frankiales bacterium]|nr:hypothetical protein [Frankiales bacterium]